MSTLFAMHFPALNELAGEEAKFLSALLPDLLRAARSKGTARLVFQDYELAARCESLGAVLVAVSWSVRRGGDTIASDIAIHYRP